MNDIHYQIPNYESQDSYARFAQVMCYTGATFSATASNFTDSTCVSSANTPWTIGLSPAGGNFTDICGTLPTPTDYYVSVAASSSQTFDGNIYYAASPTFLTGISYDYNKGVTHLAAPSKGYASAVDFNVGSNLGGASMFDMLGCYDAGAPTYNSNLLQLTFVPTYSSSQCNVAINPGSLGQPYYVQVGPDIISSGSGWSWTGTDVLINMTSVASGTNFQVSWAPAPAPAPTGSTGATNSVATTTTVTSTQTTTNSTALPPPAPISPLESFSSQILLSLFAGIVLTFIGAFYARKDPWVAGSIIAVGSYLTLDLFLYANLLAAPIDAALGFPLFLDLSVVTGPVEGWLSSFGPTGSVVVLALIFGLLGSIPLWVRPLDEWLDQVF